MNPQETDRASGLGGPLVFSGELPDGPKSPSLNMLRCCWSDYVREQAAAEHVLSALGQISQFIQFELETLRQQVSHGISDPESPIFQAVVGAFELHLEANEKMAQEFDEDNPEDLGLRFVAGFALAQKAIRHLVEAHQKTMDHIEAMAQVDCIFCQHSNARESERCAQCGRNLPGPASGSTFSVVQQEGLDGAHSAPDLTQNFVMLEEAVERWQEGDLDDAGFLAVVEKIEKRLLGHQLESQNYPRDIERAPQAAQDSLHQGLALTQRALGESLLALALIRRGFDEGDLGFVSQGFEEFETASELMIDAYRHSREAARLS